MQDILSEKRQSRRYDSRKLGYRVVVFAGNEQHEFTVLDFSANGMQIETDLSVVLPTEGTLEFRDHPYQYTVKRESSDDNVKRLGLQLHPVQLSKPAGASHYHPEHFTCQGYLRRKKWSVLFWSTALTGLCLTFAIVDGPAAAKNARSEGTFWEKLVKTFGAPSAETGWSRTVSHSSPLSTDDSGASINRISKKQSASANEVLNQARSFFSQSNYTAVIESCTQAISMNGRNAEAWHLRGNAYKGLARYDEAIHDFTRAVSLSPNAQAIQADLAETFCDAGRFNEGIKQAERSFRQAAGDLRLRFKQLASRAYKGRSANRLQDGDLEGANADLAQADRWSRG